MCTVTAGVDIVVSARRLIKVRGRVGVEVRVRGLLIVYELNQPLFEFWIGNCTVLLWGGGGVRDSYYGGRKSFGRQAR